MWPFSKSKRQHAPDRRWFRDSRRVNGRASEETAPPGGEPLSVRRWDSAKTHRLNQAHWTGVTGSSINDDLDAHLETLRTRCDFEAANNPIVDGVIQTHQIDIVKDAPKLQVQSSNERFNNEVEAAVAEFMEMPDVNGQIGGAEAIGLWVRQLWLRGCFVNVFRVTERDGPFSMALRFLDARRLDTPPDKSGGNVAFGVEMTDEGKPTWYWIKRQELTGAYDIGTTYDRFDADIVQHRFQRVEPDQLTGVPWLASCLQVIADLRDYDAEVLEAARQAANQAVFWASNHPEAEFYSVSETTDIERGTQQTGPPGWQPYMLHPTQPSTGYKEYRHERLRDLGRAVSMPLMMVLLSSAESNFASAHYDGAVYIRSIEKIQSWLGRSTLTPLAKEIAREVRIALDIRRIPREVHYEWTWKKPPYVNPKQFYDAIHARLADGTVSMQEVAAMFDTDLETLIAHRERANEMLATAGLPTVEEMMQLQKSAQPSADEKGKEVDAASNGKPVTAKKKDTENANA